MAPRTIVNTPLRQLTGLFQSRGVDQLHAHALALRAFAGRIQLQATLLAFRDAFVLTTAIVAVGAGIALFLRPAVPQASTQAEPMIAE